MTSEVLPVHKHYLIIDSPIPFYLIANDGTDKVYRMAGAWQLDLWKLLTKKENPQNPVYKLELQYDEKLLQSGQVITYSMSDINLGTGVSGVNGQSVVITENRTDYATNSTIKSDLYNLNSYTYDNKGFNYFLTEIDKSKLFSVIGSLTVPQSSGTKSFFGHFIICCSKNKVSESEIGIVPQYILVLGGGKYQLSDFTNVYNFNDDSTFRFNGLYKILN